MSPEILLVIAGLVVEVVIFVIGGVWCVSSIKSTTAVLSETIKALKQTIDSLRATIREIQNELNEHKAKIAVLEAAHGRS